MNNIISINILNFILLDSHLHVNISSSKTIVSSIERLARFGSTSDGGEEHSSDEEESDEGEIVQLARKTLSMLQ